MRLIELPLRFGYGQKQLYELIYQDKIIVVEQAKRLPQKFSFS